MRRQREEKDMLRMAAMTGTERVDGTLVGDGREGEKERRLADLNGQGQGAGLGGISGEAGRTIVWKICDNRCRIL